MKTYWLSMHVAYACRHSGACCSSGWPIPIERTRTSAVGLLRGDGSWLQPSPGAPPDIAGTLAIDDRGRCVFYDRGCEIQRVNGHAALPSACQHFPREVLIDGRGVSVSLSHYCPTAADLLFDHVGPVEVVEGPPALPSGDPEGLDAREVLPPLLAAGVLMDLEGYSAWERHMVRILTADHRGTPEDALATLERDLARVQRWRPGESSLADAISLRSESAGPGFSTSESAGPGFLSAAMAKAGSPGIDDLIIRRYLAARAFASWMAYQGGGVQAVLGSLRVALSLLRERHARLPLKQAIRETDLQVLHLMSRDALAAAAHSSGR